MVKAQIVDKISKRTGIGKPAAKIIIETCMESIIDSLSKGEEVSLRGFGSFVMKKRALRHFHAPSGKLFVIPEHNEPFFRPCKEFKKMLISNK